MSFCPPLKEAALKKYRYDPVVTGLVVGLGTISLWYFSGLAITESPAPKWVEPLSDFFTALCGALAGAFFAFKFNATIEHTKREISEKERKDKEAATINRGLLNLLIQYNTICNIKNELDKQESIHHAAFSMPAFKNFHDGTRVDVGELALILTKSPQLLLSISIEQDGFIQAIESLSVRNEFYTKILQPKMAEHNLLDRVCTLAEYELNLGHGVFKTAYTSVKLAISNVEKSHAGLYSKASQLYDAAKMNYPEYRFVKIDESNPSD